MKNIKYFAVAALILIADQLSKWAVMEHLIRRDLDGSASPTSVFAWLTRAPDALPFAQIEVLPFFNIVMVWNRGVSFGMFSQYSDYGPLLLVGLAIVITIWFAIWLFNVHARTQAIGIAMVIGGAIGNTIDRLRFDAVIDFLDFHAFGYHYPAFNIADSAIVLGVIILIIYALFFEKNVHSE